MTFTRHKALLLTGFLLATFSRLANADDEIVPFTHPLVPGLRSDELNDPNWARPFHDRVGSGFSPLSCGIDSAPRVWSSIRNAGQLDSLTLLNDGAKKTRLLVDDGRFHLLDADGQCQWTSNKVAPVLYHGPLRGGDRTYLLLGGRASIAADADSRNPTDRTTGPQLVLMDADTGAIEWQHVFNSPHGHAKPAVGDVLPERPGLEVAVFLSHAEDGCLINFPPSGDPEFVWQEKVTIPGEYDEQHDHGCDIKLDLSQPNEPIIWNIRRFRCRGFDARTGRMLSTLSYEIGGAQRRNYGPWNLGQGRDDQPLICVVSNRVQTHVHGIATTRSGENKLAWEHYYGEVHKESPGVVVEHLAIADLDNDGITEVAYTVRDPRRNLRTFVRVRDAQMGEIEVELPDCWGIAAVQNVGTDNVNCLLTVPDPDGRMPGQGDVHVYAFDQPNSVRLLGDVSSARQWGLSTVARDQHTELLFRRTEQRSKASLVSYDISGGQLQQTGRTESDGLINNMLQAEVPRHGDTPIYLNTSHEGQLQAWTWSGELEWELPLEGRYTASVSAADWNNDGKAELFATTPHDILNVFSISSDGKTVQHNAGEYLSTTAYNPTLVKNDSEQWMVISPGTSPKGNLEIRLADVDGAGSQMELPIPATVPSSIVINSGRFLSGSRPGIAVSVSDNASAQQGVYMLERDTGKLLWHRDLYRDGQLAMPYTMRGVPAAHDLDGDGAEEVVMDLLSYMAFVRGNDGSFAYILPSSNIRTHDSLYAGRLYNSFSPIYRSTTDTQAHWLVTAGIGSLGVMKPDPREGNWKHELMYEMPHRMGMIDVDNDGILEVGYAPANSNRFLCRDVWTGIIEWEVSLPHPIDAPVITADVDADGKGEFLVDRFCIGTNDRDQGEIRFQLPQPLGYGLIADFDGDGLGEIVCTHAGGISILKPQIEKSGD